MEKILLILESDVTRKLLSESLMGYEVKSCDSGEAVDTLQQFRPDALVLDLFLPGTDGLSILENCRNYLPPVVLTLSVLVTDYVQLKAAQLGAGFVIPKPCTIDYIVMRLEDMLLHKSPESPGNGDIVDKLLDRFRLHGKSRVLSALRTAILLTLRDPDCLLTKEVYPVIRKAYGGSEGAVDQAIRRMIQKAWKKRERNRGIWDDVFPGRDDCPANGAFITEVSRYLRKKYPFRFRKGL